MRQHYRPTVLPCSFFFLNLLYYRSVSSTVLKIIKGIVSKDLRQIILSPSQSSWPLDYARQWRPSFLTEVFKIIGLNANLNLIIFHCDQDAGNILAETTRWWRKSSKISCSKSLLCRLKCIEHTFCILIVKDNYVVHTPPNQIRAWLVLNYTTVYCT